jgi:hypothetical protein
VKYGIKNLKRIGKISFTDVRPKDYWAENGYDYDSGFWRLRDKIALRAQMTADQEQLIELASRVPEEQIPTAKKMLEALIVDPLWLALASAPMDDEELTPEAVASIEEARASIARGEGTPHEEILREFGLGWNE